MVSKPQPVTRATLRQAYEQLVADAAYAPATLELHRAAWKHIQHLADVPAGKITPRQVTEALKAVPGTEMRAKVRYLLTTLGAPVPVDRKPNTRARRMQVERKPLRTITADELGRLVAEMPERYKALAVYAYEQEKISEGQLARFLDCDRVTAREIVQEYLTSRDVTEDEMLELEREAFISLCGEPKSQERMQFMRMNNKPLRN